MSADFLVGIDLGHIRSDTSSNRVKWAGEGNLNSN